MKKTHTTVSAQSTILAWGNGLGIRLTLGMAKASGLGNGALVSIKAVPGAIHVTGEPSGRIGLATMRAELEEHLESSAEAIEEMAITRMHQACFPKAYAEGSEISGDAVGETSNLTDSETFDAGQSHLDGQVSSIGDWSKAAKKSVKSVKSKLTKTKVK